MNKNYERDTPEGNMCPEIAWTEKVTPEIIRMDLPLILQKRLLMKSYITTVSVFLTKKAKRLTVFV